MSSLYTKTRPSPNFGLPLRFIQIFNVADPAAHVSLLLENGAHFYFLKVFTYLYGPMAAGAEVVLTILLLRADMFPDFSPHKASYTPRRE